MFNWAYKLMFIIGNVRRLFIYELLNLTQALKRYSCHSCTCDLHLEAVVILSDKCILQLYFTSAPGWNYDNHRKLVLCRQPPIVHT
ncbi:hypothetical protein BBOV_I004205 [Babesia bovis T2Bo]|uniref:Uncharacterized protein n=1 Tax=Babesia bovis TaxID=5865 RepID=S6C7A9_BABBO|nr:hypothetical protein BBOV_I004205 [Babesia bovis T2Bo]KAG6440222.1 hypothetical protein BBOV_I004205 [Babesia bovis T2Bo]BAN64215.1 hypothetical protein [Babesia bovis]